MIFEKVQNYCSHNNISISAFEKKCGIGNGTVGRWADGASKPSLTTLEKIEKATKIPALEWMKVDSDNCLGGE